MSDSNLSRTELLLWLNRMLPENVRTAIGDVQKVEQCGSGVPFVYLLPKLFPSSSAAVSAPAKLKFPAKQEYESACNLKVIQEVLSRNQVQHAMDIDRMSKRNFQANLEFLQWFKRLCDHRGLTASMMPLPSNGGGDELGSSSGLGNHMMMMNTSGATSTPSTHGQLPGAGGAGSSPPSGSRKPSTSLSTTRSNATASGAATHQPSSRSLFGGGSSRSVASSSSIRPSTATSATATAASILRRPISPVRRSKSPVGAPAISSSDSGSGVGTTRATTPTPSSRSLGGGGLGSHRSSALTSARDDATLATVDLERRYYYDKLRKIEELVRQLAASGDNTASLVQQILYAAE